MHHHSRNALQRRSTKGGIYDLGDGPVGILPLDHLQFAVVDADLYPALNEYAWTVNKGGYVLRRDNAARKDVFLHRVVNQTPADRQTDHINGDKLDNRRSNLRSVTPSENMRGFRPPGKDYAPRGVFYNPKTGKWKAQIYRQGQCLYGGVFATKEEAIIASRRLMNSDDDTLDRASAAAEAQPRPELDL